MIIDVTQDDIDNGQCDSAICCPIARAVNRDWETQYGSVCVAENGLVFGWQKGIDEQIVIELPKVAAKFIHDFDNGRKVKPIKFIVPDFTEPDMERCINVQLK